MLRLEVLDWAGPASWRWRLTEADGGRFLAIGEVSGPHREEAGPLPHRRDVRWFAELPRSAVRTPAQLQDPRSLFRVTLTDGVPDGTAGARDRRAG